MGLKKLEDIDPDTRDMDDIADYVTYVVPDLRDLGLEGELVRQEGTMLFAIIFYSQEDLNLYKISGQCKETSFLKFMVVTKPFENVREVEDTPHITRINANSRNGYHTM